MTASTSLTVEVPLSDLAVATSVLRHDLDAGYFDSLGDFEQTIHRILAAWQRAVADEASIIDMPVEDWITVADLLGTNPGQAPDLLVAIDRALDAA